MLRAGEKGRWNATSAGAGPIGEESPRTRGRATGQVPTGHSEDRRPCAHAAGQRHSVQRDRENGWQNRPGEGQSCAGSPGERRRRPGRTPAGLGLGAGHEGGAQAPTGKPGSGRDGCRGVVMGSLLHGRTPGTLAGLRGYWKGSRAGTPLPLAVPPSGRAAGSSRAGPVPDQGCFCGCSAQSVPSDGQRNKGVDYLGGKTPQK